jgi:uncharacterized membrane protein HdeD (DUF308 family)
MGRITKGETMKGMCKCCEEINKKEDERRYFAGIISWLTVILLIVLYAITIMNNVIVNEAMYTIFGLVAIVFMVSTIIYYYYAGKHSWNRNPTIELIIAALIFAVYYYMLWVPMLIVAIPYIVGKFRD